MMHLKQLAACYHKDKFGRNLTLFAPSEAPIKLDFLQPYKQILCPSILERPVLILSDKIK
jgi:hypothetical protein